jgi:hypothetical protein
MIQNKMYSIFVENKREGYLDNDYLDIFNNKFSNKYKKIKNNLKYKKIKIKNY